MHALIARRKLLIPKLKISAGSNFQRQLNWSELNCISDVMIVGYVISCFYVCISDVFEARNTTLNSLMSPT